MCSHTSLFGNSYDILKWGAIGIVPKLSSLVWGLLVCNVYHAKLSLHEHILHLHWLIGQFALGFTCV